jgi:hypothetical protein
MDAFEKVKASSRFLKLIEQYTGNLSGQPTASGAAPGALPGANPGVVTPTAAIAANPKVNIAQKNLKKSEDELKKAQKQQAQQEINNINNQMNQLKGALNTQDPAAKAAAQQAMNDAQVKLKQNQEIIKQK